MQVRKLTLNKEHNSECYSPTKRGIYVINNTCIHNVVRNILYATFCDKRSIFNFRRNIKVETSQTGAVDYSHVYNNNNPKKSRYFMSKINYVLDY